jgi:CheY-like chemotaxis protein
MKILLVDNDPVYLNLLSEVLQLHSYEVLRAPDGEVAMEIVKSEPVDLIISDISMPKMNGLGLYRFVRENEDLKHIPFAWNSGYRELRDFVEVENTNIDFKFDKAMPLQNLLYFLSHLSGNKNGKATSKEHTKG